MGVQSLSFHDRGVWWEMLCLMHESERRGVLILNGQAMSDEALSRLLGLDKQILTTTLTSLLTSGVASREEETGAVYSRRMVRDEKLRQIRTIAGKQGGNPVLLNQKTTSWDKQIPTPSSSSSTSSTKPMEATPLPGPRPEDFANAWNAGRGPLPKVESFTDGRRKKITARIRTGMTLERFTKAVECCRTKPFLLGDNDRGWTATFDWLIANGENTEKAITNPYGSKNGNGGKQHGRGDAILESLRQSLAEDQDGFGSNGDDEGSGRSGQDDAQFVLEAARKGTL